MTRGQAITRFFAGLERLIELGGRVLIHEDPATKITVMVFDARPEVRTPDRMFAPGLTATVAYLRDFYSISDEIDLVERCIRVRREWLAQQG